MWIGPRIEQIDAAAVARCRNEVREEIRLVVRCDRRGQDAWGPRPDLRRRVSVDVLDQLRSQLAHGRGWQRSGGGRCDARRWGKAGAHGEQGGKQGNCARRYSGIHRWRPCGCPVSSAQRRMVYWSGRAAGSQHSRHPGIGCVDGVKWIQCGALTGPQASAPGRSERFFSRSVHRVRGVDQRAPQCRGINVTLFTLTSSSFAR